jgi:hypothetical protein
MESAINRFPCRAFVTEALALYGGSRSFETAEKRGADILLPHAEFFTADDIQKLNTIIRENPFDQILQARKTATILMEIFNLTAPLLPVAAQYWASITQYVVERHAADDYTYPEFLAELKKAGVNVPDGPKPGNHPDGETSG